MYSLILTFRRVCSTTPEQAEQIRKLVPVYFNTTNESDPIVIARPCAITLKDGTTHDRAYLSESLHWPRLGEWLDIRDVAEIRESPHRLPADLARKLYEAGESGMGYQLYTIEFENNPPLNCVNNNYNCDFPDLPAGYEITDAREVRVYSRMESTIDERRNYDPPAVVFWFHDKPRWTAKRVWNAFRRLVTT